MLSLGILRLFRCHVILPDVWTGHVWCMYDTPRSWFWTLQQIEESSARYLTPTPLNMCSKGFESANGFFPLITILAPIGMFSAVKEHICCCLLSECFVVSNLRRPLWPYGVSAQEPQTNGWRVAGLTLCHAARSALCAGVSFRNEPSAETFHYGRLLPTAGVTATRRYRADAHLNIVCTKWGADIFSAECEAHCMEYASQISKEICLFWHEYELGSMQIKLC